MAFSERMLQTETIKCKYLVENYNSEKAMNIDIGGPLDVIGDG